MNEIYRLFMVGLFPTIFVLGLAWFNWTAFESYYQTGKLRKSGLKIQGIITNTNKIKTPNGLDIYKLEYEYQPEGEKKYVGEQSIDHSTFRMYSKGKKIRLLYDKNNPTISNLEDESAINMPFVICIVFDVMLLFALVWLALNYKKL